MKHTRESDGPDDEDFEDDGEAEYHPEADDPGIFWCPSCGSEMYGDSTRCPKCGDYVTPGSRPSSGAMPWWMWAIMILVGLALVAGLAASFR